MIYRHSIYGLEHSKTDYCLVVVRSRHSVGGILAIVSHVTVSLRRDTGVDGYDK